MASGVRKVALVTGGGNGIGRATSILFSKSGYNVIVADINKASAEDTVKELEMEGLAVEVDVTVESQVEDMVRAGVEKFGRIDTCFNNAGIGSFRAHLADITAEDFAQVLSVNLNGVFYCMKHELRQFMKQEGLKVECDRSLLDPKVSGELLQMCLPTPVRGYIINMSSSAGVKTMKGFSPYVASKWAVVGLTKNAAEEYASKGILINCICPVFTATQMLEASGGGSLTKKLASRNNIGRLCNPSDIAQTVTWLCSGKCTYMAGEVVTISGSL